MIREEAQRKDHRESDMFVFVVLSHGTKDYIYAIDGKPGAGVMNDLLAEPSEDMGKLHIMRDIVRCFTSSCTPNLDEIPKVFIIQACQGSKYRKYLSHNHLLYLYAVVCIGPSMYLPAFHNLSINYRINPLSYI